MSMKIFGWTTKKDKRKDDEQKVLGDTVTSVFVDSAFSRRSEEIESLRKYDRGEKEITPPNLRTISKGI